MDGTAHVDLIWLLVSDPILAIANYIIGIRTALLCHRVAFLEKHVFQMAVVEICAPPLYSVEYYVILPNKKKEFIKCAQ
jgi:hypothetical protein